MKPKIHIGHRIRALRKNKNISLSELSRRTGLQIATLSRIENNRMTGTLEAHFRIASTLGIKLHELYEDIEIGLNLEGKISMFSGLG